MTHSLFFLQKALPLLAFLAVYALGVGLGIYIRRRLRQMRGSR